MKSFLVLGSAVAIMGTLSGCATMEQSEAKGPVRTYLSSKPVEKMRDCLVPVVSTDAVTGTSYGNGYRVFFQAVPSQFIHIEPSGSGSKIGVFGGVATRGLEAAVERCGGHREM